MKNFCKKWKSAEIYFYQCQVEVKDKTTFLEENFTLKAKSDTFQKMHQILIITSLCKARNASRKI